MSRQRANLRGLLRALRSRRRLAALWDWPRLERKRYVREFDAAWARGDVEYWPEGNAP